MALLKRTLISLAAAAVAAAVALAGLRIGLQTMREAPVAPVAAPEYDAWAEGVDLRVHDDAGRIDYALRAARQTRFQDGRVEWRLPALRWFREGFREGFGEGFGGGPGQGSGKGGANWRVEAERGVSAPGGERLNLSGNVVLRRDGDGNAAPLTVTTTSLEIDIPGEIVSTAAPVEMAAGPLRQRAAGLELKLAEDQLLLRGNVSGSHAGFRDGGGSGNGGGRGDDANEPP